MHPHGRLSPPSHSVTPLHASPRLSPSLSQPLPPLPPRSPLTAFPSRVSTAITVRQAEESIRYIQRELSRLLCACEYRERHPYDASSRGDGRGTRGRRFLPRRDAGDIAPLPTRKRDDQAEVFLAPSANAPFASLGPASFSAFEKRRIAHLLGRISLEIAGVWSYLHQGSSLMGSSFQGSPMDAPQARQQSVGESRASIAATPLSVAKGDLPDGVALPSRHVVHPPLHGAMYGTASEQLTVSPWEVNTGAVAAQIATLSALIEAAFAIGRALEVPESERGDTPDGKGVPADVKISPSQAVIICTPSVESGDLNCASDARRATHGTSREGSEGVDDVALPSAAIPHYLRPYVLEAAAEEVKDAPCGDPLEGRDGAARAMRGAWDGPNYPGGLSDSNTGALPEQRGVYDSTLGEAFSSAPSPPGLTAAVVERRSTTHDSFADPAAAQKPNGIFATSPPLTGSEKGKSAQAAAGASPTSDSSLNPKRVLSASPPQSTPLISSPSLTSQTSTRRWEVQNGGNARSQLSVSGFRRSQDSAEMSPSAAAAYSRSASLLRRPNRLEVPVSRTQSLLPATSLSPPGSTFTGGGNSSVPTGVGGQGSLTAAAAGAPANASSHSMNGLRSINRFCPSSSGNSGGGGGSVRTSSFPPWFPLVVVGINGNLDSPHSPTAGLHFKRVISIDSEAGVWPPGSLADSLDVSQHKVASLLGRTSGSVTSLSFGPSPMLQEGVNTATRAVVGVPGGVLRGDSSPAVPPMTELAEDGIPAPAPVLNRGSTMTPSETMELCRSSDMKSHPSALNAAELPLLTVATNSSLPRRSGTAALFLPSPTVASRQRPAHGPSASRTNASSTTVTASATADGTDSEAQASHAYHIEEETLVEFLRCLHELRRSDLSETEFNSIGLHYFLPGVSVAHLDGSTRVPSSAWTPSMVPLPLFRGGEHIPVRFPHLAAFCSLVQERLMTVCRSLGISAAAYFALM